MPGTIKPDSQKSPRARLEMLTSAMATLSPMEFSQKLATAALIPIAEVMIEKSFARKTFQVDRIDAATAVYTTKRRQTAYTVAKYGAPPTKIWTYPRLTVVPFYVQTQPEIEMSDLLDAQFDAAADILRDAGLEMAVKEDTIVLNLMNAAVPDAGTRTTNDVPVISAGPGGIGKVLSTNQYRVGSTNTAPDGGATGEPSPRDFITAQALLREIGYEADSHLIAPFSLGVLASQKAFLYWLNSGSREVQETGTLTNLFGNRIIWTPLMPHGHVYMFDTAELLRIVERESLTVKPNQLDLRMRWLVYERIAPFIRNANGMLRLSWYT